MGSLCEPLVCRTPRTARVPGGYRAHRVVKSQGEVEGIFLADRADVALTYCSGAPAVTREVPGLETVPLPLELTVGPAYGMVLLNAQALEGNQAKWRGPQHCPILPLMAHRVILPIRANSAPGVSGHARTWAVLHKI
jgi:hypothetical protein